MLLYDTSLPVKDITHPSVLEESHTFLKKNIPDSIASSPVLSDAIPLLHATTGERAASIIHDRKILSHRALSIRGDAFLSDTKWINTDELDKILGLDQFVFLSLGKMAPRIFELSDDIVIFVEKPSRVSEQSGTLYTIKEICEYGATVSQEGARERLYRGATKEIILSQNMQAIEEFYKSIMSFHFFHDFFQRFMTHYGIGIPEYITSNTFPGEKPQIDSIMGLQILQNYWQGFQCMTPVVDLSEDTIILCTQSETRKKFLRLMPNQKIYTFEHLAREIQKLGGRKVANLTERFGAMAAYLVYAGDIA